MRKDKGVLFTRPIYFISVTLIAIFVIELFLMQYVWRMEEWGYSHRIVGLIDAVGLTFLLVPVMYLFLFVPILKYIREIEQMQHLERKMRELEKAKQQAVDSRDFCLTLFDGFPALIWRSGIDAQCNYFNKTWLDFTGRTIEQEIGEGWTEGVHPDDLENYLAVYLAAFRTQTAFSTEYRLKRHDGKYRWIVNRASPYDDTEGSFAGYVGSCYDVTDKKVADESLTHERIRAEEYLQKGYQRLRITLNETVNAFIILAEKRDPYTAGHQHRVAQLAVALAREMGLEQKQIEGLEIAAKLHDIGKVYVPAEILNKPGLLTDPEMSLIKIHPTVGQEILGKIPFEAPVGEIIAQHHERLNGSGYPKGLTADEIRLEAKILAVADIVEAIASHRPYRPALGLLKAFEELERNKGILYDPKAVEACLRIFRGKDLFNFETGNLNFLILDYPENAPEKGKPYESLGRKAIGSNTN